jgi:hypothetical protein
LNRARGSTAAAAAFVLLALAGDPIHAAEPAPAAGGGAITWERMRPHFTAVFYIVRTGAHRWGFTAKAGDLPPADPDRTLRLAAVEALDAAHDDLVWFVGEIFDFRPLVMQPVADGATLKLRDEYLNPLFEDPSFAAPLRRFTDGILRARGFACSDCLAGLGPSREVSWPQVRDYLERFIHVKEVDPSGRVDLHVAAAENRIPEFHSSHHDLAAAVYSAMHGAIADSPEFQRAVREDLSALLDQAGDAKPESIRSRLNMDLPRKVLTDPRCLSPILAHLPQALERHSLHCVDCPAAR